MIAPTPAFDLGFASVVTVNRHRHRGVLLSPRRRRPRNVLGLKRDGFCVCNFFSVNIKLVIF